MIFASDASTARLDFIKVRQYKILITIPIIINIFLYYYLYKILPTICVAILSLREMGDYKTTRLLDCCALDRIWSSMQRLEDLDWFGPEMPYVQYGGGVLALLLSSPGAQSSEGSLQAGLVVSNPWESNHPFSMWGA